MQMSIERFREVHKLIWNTVIENAIEVIKGNTEVWILKGNGVDRAYNKGLLDSDEADFIRQNNNCLLCASCLICWECVLRNCGSDDSLYNRACYGDVDSMLEIRDIVDKKPFTESSIITLYK